MEQWKKDGGGKGWYTEPAIAVWGGGPSGGGGTSGGRLLGGGPRKPGGGWTPGGGGGGNWGWHSFLLIDDNIKEPMYK